MTLGEHIIVWSLSIVPVLAGFPARASEQSAAVGDYIIIRGALRDCDPTLVVMDVDAITSDAPVSLVGLPDIEVVGRTAEQIRETLGTRIEEVTGKRPGSLVVQLTRSEAEYQTRLREYLTTLRAIIDDECPIDRPAPAKPESWRYIDEMERIEPIDRYRRIVGLATRPNEQQT